MEFNGNLHKMKTAMSSPITYSLSNNNDSIELNQFIGRDIILEHNGKKNCIGCNKEIAKTYQQGYCFNCCNQLASCDFCILRPAKCHYHLGTCREPEWGLVNCFRNHVVYLSISSDVKVGITRQSQLPTRWIDQGAVKALPIMLVKSRLQAGLLEDIIRQTTKEATNWRKMLSNQINYSDLLLEKESILNTYAKEIADLSTKYPNEIVILGTSKIIDINYPVIEYPNKITALNFDKTTVISGKLLGIKGQYLILTSGVLNIRKFAGYKVKLSVVA